MRSRRRLVVPLALAVFSLASLASAASIVDQVQVGVPGRAVTKAFAPSLALVLTSPPSYKDRACCYNGTSGSWAGPPYRADGDPNRGGTSQIGWTVTFMRTAASPAALAHQAPFLDAPRIAGGKVAISHVVSGRRVGSLPGAYVVVGESAPGARHQVAVVVPLTSKVKAITLFDVSTPFSDSAGSFGQYTIQGVRPSVWNRQQALLLGKAVALDGSLPPSRIRVGVARGRASGTVVDSYGDPVAEAPIKLLARRGRKWIPRQKASTSTRGRFSFANLQSGSYRILVTLGGSQATRQLRVR